METGQASRSPSVRLSDAMRQPLPTFACQQCHRINSCMCFYKFLLSTIISCSPCVMQDGSECGPVLKLLRYSNHLSLIFFLSSGVEDIDRCKTLLRVDLGGSVRAVSKTAGQCRSMNADFSWQLVEMHQLFFWNKEWEFEEERAGSFWQELFVSENGCNTSYLIIKGVETITMCWALQSLENTNAPVSVPRETGLSVTERVWFSWDGEFDYVTLPGKKP